MAREFKFKKIPLAPKSSELLDYREQILTALRQPTKPGGVDYEEASKRLPLITKVVGCKGETIVFEDAEWEETCAALKRLKYMGILESWVNMTNELLNAPTVELTPVKAPGDAPHESATI